MVAVSGVTVTDVTRASGTLSDRKDSLQAKRAKSGPTTSSRGTERVRKRLPVKIGTPANHMATF